MEMTGILDLLIRLLTALAVAFLLPWLKSRYSAEKLTDLMNYVTIFVRAAEQLFDAADGSKKKQWVLAQLAERGVKIDSAALDAMVEASVNELRHALPLAK